MSKRNVLSWIVLIAISAVLCNCGQPSQTPKAQSRRASEKREAQAKVTPEAAKTAAATAAAAKESLPTSQTAAKSEQAIAAAQPAAPAAAVPADHWLAGTSDVPDMVPATIAADAPRKLLAESGPAYLEQIGDTRVLHLKGSYHDMGVQHGTLLKDDIVSGASLIYAIGAAAWKKDFATSLQDAWNRTSPFIPDKFKQEIQGMAEATGLPLEQVQGFTIFPELFHCSGFAMWGKATADGSLYHGRVLDYMRDAGLDRWALLIVQEPEGANAFVNVGYAGTIGSVTGMNVQQIGIGEMGGGGGEQWDGVPMTLLVRDCLERANTLEDVRRIMTESKRTCQYFYVISDAKADNGRGSALGVAAEPGEIVFIGPNESNPRLPRPVEDAVLLSADERYNCLVDRVQKMYGKITPPIALDVMARGVAMTSNMHDALFKPKTLELWVANSTVEQPACNRPYTHYDLNQLIKEKPAP